MRRLFFVFIFVSFFALSYCRVLVAVPESVTVEGRLELADQGTEGIWLVLHAKDGSMFRLSGGLVDALKETRASLGEKNLVTLRGTTNGKSITPCTASTSFPTDDKGRQVEKTVIECIPYRELAVSEIVAQVVSDEVMASAKRDKAKEQEFARTMPRPGEPPVITGEIYGKITALNLRSPIKTVILKNRDRQSELKELVLLLEPQTQVIKKIGSAEPVVLSIKSLAVDQEVTTIYTEYELRATAKTITITKE